MMPVEQAKAVVWLAYRVARRWWYTALGRNPLLRAGAAPSVAFEWRSIRGLTKSKANPPHRIRTEGSFTLWSTTLGELWTPSGVSEDYVSMLIGEMAALVYDLSALPGKGAGATVLDIGANIGVFSRWAFRHGAEKVVSFEPSPGNAECLRRNLANEMAAGRAFVIEKGLWDTTTTVSFSATNELNPGSHCVVENGKGEVTVPVVKLDDTFAELGLNRLDYIKMDIEGAEERALAGALKTIARFRPQLCVVVEHTDDIFANGQGVVARIAGAGCGYRYRATEAHTYVSPSRGRVLTPYSLLFYPAESRS